MVIQTSHPIHVELAALSAAPPETVPAFIPRLEPTDTIHGNGSHGGTGGS